MKILSFRMKFADEKWPVYLEKEFGKETSEKFTVESHGKNKNSDAKIIITNFKKDPALIEKLKSHDGVSSAYIINNDIVTQL